MTRFTVFIVAVNYSRYHVSGVYSPLLCACLLHHEFLLTFSFNVVFIYHLSNLSTRIGTQTINLCKVKFKRNKGV